LFKCEDVARNSLLLVLVKAVPPLLELIGVLDFPLRHA
jgi:hypothetical protein